MKPLSQQKLSDHIKDKRAALQITQEQLCVSTGINRTIISRIERCDYIPTIPQLEKPGGCSGF